jgi:transposase-like protein
MGQLLHGSARTTAAVRRAIQRSQESIAKLAKRYDLNPKTVAKWKKRTQVDDAPMGPKQPRSTVLSPEEEAMLIAFRRHTLLPLDDCLYALQATIPHLTRSALHRCLKRHGINRLPDIEGDKPAKKKFKPYPIGYFHIDIAEVRTEEGTVLTDNGIQFTNRKRDHYAFQHIFARVCQAFGIDHRLTKTNHPWTNGQVERMNRTLKEATVKKYHYQTHQHLREHLYTFLMAYNFAKRLKTLKGLTPYEYICGCWQKEPERFISNPHHHTLGLNI